MKSQSKPMQLPGCDWSKASVKRYGDKEYLFFEGDEKRWLYRVSRGAVCLFRTPLDGRRQIFGFRFREEILGLEAGSEYALSAQAVGSVELKCLPFNSVKDQAKNKAEIALQLYNAISTELAATRDFLEMLCRHGSTERVACFLLDLLRRDPGQLPRSVYLPMNRGDIADFLSITVETLSRALAKLSQNDLIDARSRSIIVIKDAEGLERAARPAAHPIRPGGGL